GTLCPKLCEVDRLSGPAGYCRLGAEARVFRHYASYSEEPELSPTYEVLFTGCSHRCRFCSVLGPVERPQAVPACAPDEVVAGVRAAAARGVRTVSVVGG